MNARGGMSDGIAVDLLELQSLLQFIQADGPRDEWFRVLAGIKDEFGENGKDMARDWSAQSDKFKPRDFESTWRSLKPGHITVATVFKHAMDGGYSPKRRARKEYKRPVKRPKHPIKSNQLTIEAANPRPDTWAEAKVIWAAVEADANKYRADDYVAGHPYAKSKWIRWAAGAARFPLSRKGCTTDAIAVPLSSYPNEQIIGIEIIARDGGKFTLGNKGILVLGNDLDYEAPQFVVEGWATGARTLLTYKFNCAIYVAGSKNAQRKVAKAVMHHTQRDVTILGEADSGE